MLYRKSLRITAASKGKMGVGAIVNLQSNDASKLWGMAQYLHIIWSGPFQVLLLLFHPGLPVLYSCDSSPLFWKPAGINRLVKHVQQHG